VPHGRVHTFEFHESRAELAAKEFDEHGLTKVVKVHQRDVEASGFPKILLSKSVEGEDEVAEWQGASDGAEDYFADAVFLDLPRPWRAIPSAAKCLKPGGVLCSFSPCIEQVQKTCEEAAATPCFASSGSARTMEILLRPYEVKQERIVTPAEPEAGGALPDPEDWNQSSRKEENVKTRLLPVPGEIRGHTGYLTFVHKAFVN